MVDAPHPQTTKARAQPNLGFPRDCDDILRLTFQSRLKRFANACREPVIPSRFDQDPAHVRITRSSELATMSRRSARVLARDQAEIAHQVFRMPKSSQIAELRDNGRGGEEVKTS